MLCDSQNAIIIVIIIFTIIIIIIIMARQCCVILKTHSLLSHPHTIDATIIITGGWGAVSRAAVGWVGANYQSGLNNGRS